MKKYLILPGMVTSNTDSDRHFITAHQLIRLYGVNPEECQVCHSVQDFYVFSEKLIVLRPRYDGDYSLSNVNNGG